MKDRLSEALEAGLSAIARGEDLDIWLSRHPNVASELRPILEAAEELSKLPGEGIPRQAFLRTRSRILGRAVQLRLRPPTSRRMSWFPRKALAVLVVVAVLFGSTGGLVVASANTLPGDNLYSLKRAVEDLSLSLAPSRRLRHDLASTYQQRRLEEYQELVGLGEEEYAIQVLPEVSPTDEEDSSRVSANLTEDEATAPADETQTPVPPTQGTPSLTPEPTYTPTRMTSATNPVPVTATPTHTPTPPGAASCELITVDEWDYGLIEVQVDDYAEDYRYDKGGRIRFHIRNDNEAGAYLSYSTLDWNALNAPPMYFDYFKFKGDRYFRVDSYSSPSSGLAPSIELKDSKWWEAVFYLEDQPFEGTFRVTLTFNVQGLGDCRVTAQAQIPR